LSSDEPRGGAGILRFLDRPPRLSRSRDLLAAVLDWVAIGAFLGIGLGYLAFYSMLPSVAFPSTERPDILLILGVLVGLGILGGFLARDVEDVVAHSFVGLLLGVATDFLITISPIWREGLLATSPVDFAFMVLRFSLPLLFVSFVVWVVTGILGLYVQEVLRRRTPAEDIFPGLREDL